MANPPRPPPGTRFGGRQKGTPNKRTAFSVKARLEEMGFDLIGEIMKTIALIDVPRDQAKCYLQLLEYCDAKRKAVEMSGSLNTTTMTNEELLEASREAVKVLEAG